MAADIFIGNAARNFAQTRLQFGPALRRIENPACRFPRPDHLHQRSCIAQNRMKSGRTFRLDEIVRVLPFRQKRKAQRLAGLQDRQAKIGSTIGRTKASAVTVKTEDRLGADAPEKFKLFFGQSSAKRSHHMMDTGLRKRDDVHIAFDGNDRLGRFAALRLAGLARPQAVIKHAPLMKELCFGRIEIFRRRIRRKSPPAKSDDPPTQILDREHHAITETIVGNRYSLAMHHKAAGFDLLAGNALACQKLLQRIA